MYLKWTSSLIHSSCRCELSGLLLSTRRSCSGTQCTSVFWRCCNATSRENRICVLAVRYGANQLLLTATPAAVAPSDTLLTQAQRRSAINAWEEQKGQHDSSASCTEKHGQEVERSLARMQILTLLHEYEDDAFSDDMNICCSMSGTHMLCC
jgi:hypothetical protein